MHSRRSQLLPFWPSFLQHHQFPLSSLQWNGHEKSTRCNYSVKTTATLCWSSGKATLKRTARSLEATPSDSRVSISYQDATLLEQFFSTEEKLLNAWASNLGELKQIKPKLGMQVSDQHRTKLLFSSKLCQMYIQSYQPAMEAKHFLADPATFDQNRNNRKVKRSLSFRIVALLCKFPLVTLEELQLSQWGLRRFHEEQNIVRIELHYPWLK